MQLIVKVLEAVVYVTVTGCVDLPSFGATSSRLQSSCTPPKFRMRYSKPCSPRCSINIRNSLAVHWKADALSSLTVSDFRMAIGARKSYRLQRINQGKDMLNMSFCTSISAVLPYGKLITLYNNESPIYADREIEEARQRRSRSKKRQRRKRRRRRISAFLMEHAGTFSKL